MIATNSDEKDSIVDGVPSENERLVRAIKSGDPEAERTFVDRYLKPVRAMLMARSRNPDTASDLQQDVMIEAICALRRGQLQDPEKLAAFVSAIARNLLNNYFRSSRRTESLDLPDNLPDLSFTLGYVEEEQRANRAAEAIASLDPIDRAILQMTLIDGMKPAGIAEQLKMRSDVVRQRKVRATRKVIQMVRSQSQNTSPSHIHEGKAP